MLGKWLCTKRNPSGIHKAISEVRQSWNVGVLHVNFSRSTTSFQRTSKVCVGEKSTRFKQKQGCSHTHLATLGVLCQFRSTVPVAGALQRDINPAALCEWAECDRRTVVIERAWHKRNEKCSQWRTISNASYQLKAREQCLHSHSKARHWVCVSNRSRLEWKQKLVD